MALPDSVVLVPVVAGYIYRDANGSVPAGKRVVFVARTKSVVVDDEIITLPTKLQAVITAEGELPADFALPTCGDDGVYYDVHETFAGGRGIFTIPVLPTATVINLAAVAPVVAPPELVSIEQAAVVRAAYTARDAAIAAAEDAEESAETAAAAAAAVAGLDVDGAIAAGAAATAGAASAAASASTAQISASEAAGSAQSASTDADAAALSASAAAASIATGGIYVSTSAGLAAVAEGGYFSVPSGDPDESLILYRDVAGVAVEIKRYPSATVVSAMKDRLTGTQTVGRPAAATLTSGTGDTGTFIMSDPVAQAGVLARARIYVPGDRTLKFKRMTKSGDVFSYVDQVTVATTGGAGVKTLNVGLAVAAGDRIGVYVPSNGMQLVLATPADSGGWFKTSADVTTTFTDNTADFSSQLQVSFDIEYDYVTNTRVAAMEALHANTRLDALEQGGGVEQIIGKQSTLVVNTTSANSGTFCFSEEAIGDGRVTQVSLFAGSAPGIVHVKVFDTSVALGDLLPTVTQVGADYPLPVLTPNAINTFAVDIPIRRGQKLGVYNPSATTMRRSIITTPLLGAGVHSLGSGNLITAPIQIVPYEDRQAELSFKLKVVRASHRLSLNNSDRIIVLGDSYAESPYTPRGKSWLAKLSESTDWVLENFGVSGENASENLGRIRANTLTLGRLPYRARFGTYALIYVGVNDKADGITLANFMIDMKQLIETAKGLGATPILVSPHAKDNNMWGLGFSAIFRSLAEETGSLFVDVTEWARVNDYGTRHAAFWNGTHPGVRTNEIQVAPVERLLDQLEAPRQSVKFFRKRSGVSVSTVADLAFNTHYERRKLWKEILVGTAALKVANESLYDAVNTVVPGTHTEFLNSEYIELQRGGKIAMGDYSLVEITLPTNVKNVDYLTVTFNETAATLYGFNILGGTIVDGSPVGAWEPLEGAGGIYRLSNYIIRRMMRQFKLSLMLVKSGGIAAFAEPKIEWVGTPVAKPQKVGKTWGRRGSGAELLANTDMGVATNWTATGTISRGAPADGCLPIGSTGRVTVDNSNYVSQPVTWPADNTRAREVEIRVNLRRFPTIDDGSITAESFDEGLAQIEIEYPAGRIPYIEAVKLWWGDIVLRTIAPLGTTGLTLHVRTPSGQPALEAATASVRFVD